MINNKGIKVNFQDKLKVDIFSHAENNLFAELLIEQDKEIKEKIKSFIDTYEKIVDVKNIRVTIDFDNEIKTKLSENLSVEDIKTRINNKERKDKYSDNDEIKNKIEVFSDFFKNKINFTYKNIRFVLPFSFDNKLIFGEMDFTEGEESILESIFGDEFLINKFSDCFVLKEELTKEEEEDLFDYLFDEDSNYLDFQFADHVRTI